MLTMLLTWIAFVVVWTIVAGLRTNARCRRERKAMVVEIRARSGRGESVTFYEARIAGIE